MSDIYYFKTKVEREMLKLDPDAVQFVRTLQKSNYSISRIYRHIETLIILSRFLGRPLRDATKDDLERFVMKMTETKTPWTRDTTLRGVKIFYRWLLTGSIEKSAPYPDIVKWIRTGVKRNETKEPEILTEDEVKALISSAKTARDKAIIAVLYDGGFRIGEILPAKIGDVSFDDMGAKIRVSGKTGGRTERLITSVPLLSQWLDQHPGKGNPDAWLWESLPGKHLSYVKLRVMLKRTAKRAGVKKRIYPHLFRHSSATANARYLTEYEMRLRYGWASGSDTPSRYVHMASADLDDKLAAIYKGKETKPKAPEFVPLKCPRCGAENTPGQRYCGKCGSPLNPEEIAKSAIPNADLLEKLADILKDIAELKKKVEK
ncbi:MAG: tyrosine-type recombinase/integrase [Nitrososphaerota archaeon]|nr:tyrosine-type recombinase/integrase [Nitrososphaerota archaeon]MDG6927173.1 tyrosine-type recombinase/integrase [Nitrososphaerota archaeon]MDG6930839.1 tyrosine-type recombinase/integrase [Nitrososphaerota archaeon]MDG6932283.1 tyrosine-type recombinase/integrase [Nitrososphaerota archaeon]MDG6936312.1 tyrosine-type recombinase/integrase [Nitrososphaerota archaeon]